MARHWVKGAAHPKMGPHMNRAAKAATGYQKPSMRLEVIPPEGSDPGANLMNRGNFGGVVRGGNAGKG